MQIPKLPALACLLVSASVANAQPGTSPEPPPVGPPSEAPPAPPPASPETTPPAAPTEPPAEPPVPPPSVDKGVLEDANSGRGWLLPTALTPPAGTWSFSDFELLIGGGGYSFTDRFQVSLATVIPLTSDFPIVGLLNAKYQFLRTGRVRAAAQAAGFLLNFRSDEDSESFFAANVGGALTFCIDLDCHSHATGYAGTGIASEEQTAFPLMFGAAVALKAARHVKFVFEVDSAAVLGDINTTADGFLLWYGARFTSKFIGVDLGFVKPIYDGSGDDEVLPLGLPIVSFTYRGIE
jgi:hypothetical protein